jgi:hypothetical protein
MVSQQQTIEILEVQSRLYSRFHPRGTHFKVRLNPPPPTTPVPDPVTNFVDIVKDLFECVLEHEGGGDMVRIKIQNEVNQSDTPIGFIFRRKGSVIVGCGMERIRQSDAVLIIDSTRRTR